MKIFEELQARELIAQVTDNDEIRDLINNGGARFYIGFDPTADSLHVGHFMALCLMKRLQLAGNTPIVLMGGGTGHIGDPSGRSDMRSMMTTETINNNVECFKKQISRFIDFENDKAIMVNNADWLLDLKYIEEKRSKIKGTFCHRCGYCLPCSVGIDIPTIFTYEKYYIDYDLKDWAKLRYSTSKVDASACINCGACIKRCPYGIDIPKRMEKIKKLFSE